MILLFFLDLSSIILINIRYDIYIYLIKMLIEDDPNIVKSIYQEMRENLKSR